MSEEFNNGFPGTTVTYGTYYGKYVNAVINAAVFRGRYRDGAFPISIDDILKTIKGLYDKGIGVKFYKNPVRFLDQLAKQGKPCSYFSHPNTRNHLWNGLKTTMGDFEVFDIDYTNFVVPSTAVVEKWKEQTQSVTGIKANSIDILVTGVSRTVFARATYLVSGHLQKFEICLPGKVWHDVTFNYGIIDNLPVFTEMSSKADADFFETFNQPLVQEGGAQILSVDPDSEAVVKASKEYEKTINKTFTLYGTLDATQVSEAFMYLSEKYSNTEDYLKNPITSGSNCIACIAMERYDPVEDKKIFDKVYGTDRITRHLVFKVIDTPDMSQYLFDQYVERKEFLKQLPSYGFVSHAAYGHNSQVTKGFSIDDINSHCSFIAPNTMLFGTVLPAKDSIKVIDTSISVVSKVLDTFIIPRRMVNYQLPENQPQEVKEFLEKHPKTWISFPDLKLNPTFLSSSDKSHAAFEMYQITQIEHEQERFRNKAIRYSSGSLTNNFIRHYPFSGARVKVMLGVMPFGSTPDKVYEAAHSESMNYDQYSYSVLPEEDGRYLHGALTADSLCICGKSIKDHTDHYCPYTEGELKLYSYNSNNKVALYFLEYLRYAIDSTETPKPNNVVDVNLIWMGTALMYLIENRKVAMTDKKIAETVKSIFMLSSELTLPNLCVYGETEQLRAFTWSSDDDSGISVYYPQTGGEKEIPDVEGILNMSQRQLEKYLSTSSKQKPQIIDGKIIVTQDNYEFIVYLLKYVKGGIRISQYFTQKARFGSIHGENDSYLRKSIMRMISHPLNILQSSPRLMNFFNGHPYDDSLIHKAIETLYTELDECLKYAITSD